MTTPISGAGEGTALVGEEAGHHRGTDTRARIDRVAVGDTRDGPEPVAGAAGRGKAIDQAARDIRHPRPFVEREQLDTRSVGIGEFVDRDNALASMLQEVGRQLGGDERDPCLDILGEALAPRQPRCCPPRLGDFARIAHRIDDRHLIASNAPA